LHLPVSIHGLIINGLVAQARHNISTGKLEGFNNKIKVVKRIGYGCRNEDCFFTLIRYMSIPTVRFQSRGKREEPIISTLYI
jgi:hypothetical protein